MAFYRTYRPQIIDEIDNATVREAFLSLLSKPKKELPHAYFFSGPRGAGKTTAARVIAKLFNCQKPTKHGPCGACEQCVSIAGGRNLDVIELDAASNRGIDEIRTLREGIGLAPVSGEFKIFIIDEVHMLTTEAFNALLKTLEEPPAHAAFVLATTDAHKVPVTITSRCMTIAFSKASSVELLSALSRIVKKEKLEADSEALKLIVQHVDGSFRDAVKFLEQASFHKGNIDEKTVRSILSLSTSAEIAEFNAAYLARDSKKSLKIVQRAVDAGMDMKNFLMQTLEHLHGMLLTDPSNTQVHEAIRKLSVAYVEMRTSPIPQLPLELAVAEYCNETSDKKQETTKDISPSPTVSSSNSLTLDHLTNHWNDVIAELKPFNHSVAGVMRSTRPQSVKDGIVTIVAFYTFHKDKLSEVSSRQAIAQVIKKLFGETVSVEIVLGKK